jgi:hypothetical protein
MATNTNPKIKELLYIRGQVQFIGNKLVSDSSAIFGLDIKCMIIKEFCTTIKVMTLYERMATSVSCLHVVTG